MDHLSKVTTQVLTDNYKVELRRASYHLQSTLAASIAMKDAEFTQALIAVIELADSRTKKLESEK